MHPVILYREGYSNERERRAAEAHFDVYTHRSIIPKGSLVIGRYSVIPFYAELCVDLVVTGSEPINSASQHRYIADLGNWYRDLQGLTPETWTELDAVPDDAWPCVLKGETNSRKWQWKTAMFAADRAAGIEVRERLQQDGLLCDQHIYFRRFVKLAPVHPEGGAIISGPPVSREFRFFVCDGQVLSAGFYWSMFDRDDIDPYPDPAEVPQSLLAEVIGRVGKNARFYVIDVAQTANGDWIVVELNEGQMSGLSDNDPDVLYRRLKEVIGPVGG